MLLFIHRYKLLSLAQEDRVTPDSNKDVFLSGSPVGTEGILPWHKGCPDHNTDLDEEFEGSAYSRDLEQQACRTKYKILHFLD